MKLFAPALAFVDLETTGTRAAFDRVTEIGVVRVDTDPAGGPPRVDEWSSLVDPGVPIPAAIQALTGITDAMVRGAPAFASLARDVAERLDGCLFVAHNARFDFGFLKHEFARVGTAFSPRVLCTVRLSRRLDPEASSHGLDAVIARHGLDPGARHRALGDARALWLFVRKLYASLPAADIEVAVKRLLRIPSLPPQLAPDALDAIPDAPGVYLFYGDNPLPLYVGKSIHLRDRVAAHFCSDWQHETDLRLSAEIRRIEVETTAGELGALLREAALVKSALPAHNRALRRKQDAGVMTIGDDGRPAFVRADDVDPASVPGAWGPYSSKRAMRAALQSLAAEHRLCWTRLGLERRDGPCFARQLRRCEGACVGAEPADAHDARLRDAIAAEAIPSWPWEGPALVREASPDGSRTDVHVVRDWHWIGTARDEGELGMILDAPVRPSFDLDVSRLLLKLYARSPGSFLPAPARGRDAPTAC
ncbi:Excinuclease cho [Burkholderiales bacterium]|nr:Excinuclease cho [Burkholderiales bacterium]